jgi:hypothetical protein
LEQFSGFPGAGPLIKIQRARVEEALERDSPAEINASNPCAKLLKSAAEMASEMQMAVVADLAKFHLARQSGK